jgi:hypothetical protein
VSEYQYYEFVAIDRPLDERQLDEVRALSTRAHITPTSFVDTYEWGDFRGNPRELMERYYDAFLYLANWGTHGEHLVIDLVSEDEEADFDWGGEGWLTSVVPVRAELVVGDLRLLYLGWLLCVQNHEVPDEEVEPPTPAGLGKLTASLKAVAEFLRIDPDLLDVAAQRAPTTEPSAEDMAGWVASLPAAEKDAALLTLLRGDDPHLRAGLLRRFRGATPAQPGNRTAGELRAAAEARWKDRVRAEEERKRRPGEERERERAAKRARRLATLAAEGDRVWARVDAMIETKKPAEYDRAVDLLEDLRNVAEPAEFASSCGAAGSACAEVELDRPLRSRRVVVGSARHDRRGERGPMILRPARSHPGPRTVQDVSGAPTDVARAADPRTFATSATAAVRSRCWHSCSIGAAGVSGSMSGIRSGSTTSWSADDVTATAQPR